jgi:dimeric dUTPase (all-alpha-NTP-PPase superfamily)
MDISQAMIIRERMVFQKGHTTIWKGKKKTFRRKHIVVSYFTQLSYIKSINYFKSYVFITIASASISTNIFGSMSLLTCTIAVAGLMDAKNLECAFPTFLQSLSMFKT